MVEKVQENGLYLFGNALKIFKVDKLRRNIGKM